MIGGGDPLSLEGRLGEIGVVVLAVLLAVGGLVWAAGELAGLLAHHAWPPLRLADAPGMAIALLQHPGDPAVGWPPAARALAPPAWLDWGVLALLVAGALAGGLALLTHRLRAPDDLRGGLGGVDASLRQRPNGRWQERPFLGWVGWGPLARMVMGTPEDCVAVVGPPRVGKTQGVLIPQLLLWGGPAVSASTKPDVLGATLARRRELAAAHGGRVLLWAPTAPGGPPPGVEAVGWSPLAGCELSETCERRVRALVGASNTGVGARNANHWRENAIRLLRGYFHAAALDGQGIRTVLRWLGRNDLREPAVVLRGADSLVAEVWADELEGMERVPPEELGSIFSAARTAMGSLQNGRVLASCDDLEPLDVDRFLETRSTLYLIAPTADQELLAPLAAALVEHLVQRSYERWEQGTLPARLLLNLDELVNITPIPTLLKILTQGASQGVNLTWAVQSLAQFRDRYGAQVAEAAFSSSRARLVFGGLMDARDLEAISQLAGEHEVPSRSLTWGVGSRPESVTAGTIWRPRLPVAAIRGIPPGRAMLLYHTSDPALVEARLAARTGLWRRLAGQGPERRGARRALGSMIQALPRRQRRG